MAEVAGLRTHAERDAPPRAVGRLDHVGVAGVLHGQREVRAVEEDGVAWVALPGPRGRRPALDRRAVGGTAPS